MNADTPTTTLSAEHEAHPLAVFLKSSSGHESKGVFTLKVLSRPERLARAWRAAGICLGLALVSIFLPLLHFLLVPGFLIAAPFAFSWMMSWESVILPSDVPCPSCGTTVHIKYNREKWPFYEVCTHCRNELVATRADS
jgi:hypothetical protein